jgi:hypothetical protein
VEDCVSKKIINAIKIHFLNQKFFFSWKWLISVSYINESSLCLNANIREDNSIEKADRKNITLPFNCSE